ncbi:MAG: benzoate-CoA ligase family protein [Gemmatimonadota bacterium]|uniref:benzoate-CoA ligase family protein n=1 Tax=Candidatus Palauibacter scopulicola TaxID=3056741 RepID=UPI00239DF6D8|nr:benzoate-CoA ligase family protein [Candidatus Palauibacter scopulicola]MDE2663366.1 benzoate-CoA ligase family protein [Candidatus Palauibacter scopulicola]
MRIERSVVPARLRYGETFNAASWYIDRHVAEGRGGKVAIEQAAATVTYAELAGRVAQAGNALLGLGLAPGDRVLMVVKDGPEFFFFFWGAIKAGIVPVPVSYLMRARDLAFIVADSECRAVVYSPEFAAEVVPALAAARTGARGLALEAEGGVLDDVDAAPPELEAATARPDDVAFWLYSSGTTGRPKGVPHRHRDMPATCEHYAVGILGLGEDDRCYSAAKLFFVYGLGNAMTFPLWVGGTAILDERRPTPATTFETIETLRPTAYFGVPTLYAAQLQALDQAGAAGGGPAGQGGPDLTSLRLCVSAGEALPPDLFRRWKAATGLEILDGIGSTEALHIFISNAPGDVKPGSTGRVVPGYEARIVGEDGAESGPGEAGQLEIRGDSTTPGYWNRPELEGRTIVDGWLRTGDQYVRDAAGWFHYQGRADDMIKVGGIWCSPFDIEARLMEHPSVLEAAVVGREDDHGLVKPEAHVVLSEPLRERVGAESAGDALAAELVRHCKEELPRYMYPRWVRFVAELPKTATGKIQRFRLRESSCPP